MNTNQFYITNFIWLKYSYNSCRLDVFSTLHIHLLFDYISENLSNINYKIKNIHVFFEDKKKKVRMLLTNYGNNVYEIKLI